MTVSAASSLVAQTVPTSSVTLLPATPYYSDSVTVTVRLAGPAGTVQPTGTLSYTIDTGSASTATLTAGTAASLAYLQITPKIPGAHTLTFSYSGASNYASTKAALQVQGFAVADRPLALVGGSYPLNPYITDDLKGSGFVDDYYASGIAVDPVGNVYLSTGTSDGGTPGITKIDTNGIGFGPCLSADMGMVTVTPATFGSISGLTYQERNAGDTYMYVVDKSNNSVSSIHFALNFKGSYPNPYQTLPFAGLKAPSQIFVDGSHNVFVLDAGALNGGNRIVCLDHNNVQTVLYTDDTGDAAGLLASVSSFTLDIAGNLYLGGKDKNGKGTIARQSPLGNEVKLVANINVPTLMTTDALYNIFFTDTAGNLVRADRAGNVTSVATGLVTPTSLSLDPSGTAYLTSATGQTIATVSPAGAIAQITFPGSTHPAFAIAEDLGSIFVADSSLQQVLVDARSQGTINFGTIAVGATATQNDTVRNIGNLALVPFTFSSAAPFSIASAASNGCQDTTAATPPRSYPAAPAPYSSATHPSKPQPIRARQALPSRTTRPTAMVGMSRSPTR